LIVGLSEADHAAISGSACGRSVFKIVILQSTDGACFIPAIPTKGRNHSLFTPARKDFSPPSKWQLGRVIAII